MRLLPRDDGRHAGRRVGDDLGRGGRVGQGDERHPLDEQVAWLSVPEEARRRDGRRAARVSQKEDDVARM